MKRGLILNAELSHAIAAMGHGDFIIVCDAGFPIPSDAWRIDLAVVEDFPTHELVLSAIAADFVAEKVTYGVEMETYNPQLLEVIKRTFPDSDLDPIPHSEIMTTLKHSAKAIVRTGAFAPYGNILLHSGVDAPKWFNKPNQVIPEFYQERLAKIRQIRGGQK